MCGTLVAKAKTAARREQPCPASSKGSVIIMVAVFYVSAVVAVISTFMVITRMHAVHALLYLVVSLLAVALAFFAMGAHFVAALEVMIYAGAIMMLFVFVIMMLNLGSDAADRERRWMRSTNWVGPVVLASLLGLELIWVMARGELGASSTRATSPVQVGIVLFGPYLLGVELASMLLLAGLVGAYHIGRPQAAIRPDEDDS